MLPVVSGAQSSANRLALTSTVEQVTPFTKTSPSLISPGVTRAWFSLFPRLVLHSRLGPRSKRRALDACPRSSETSR